MFMMKRLALVGAAGLAALSISCSEDGGEDSGSFTQPFTVTDTPAAIVLGGQITADGDNQVGAVAITVGGNAVNFVDPLTLPAQVVTLTGVRINGVCGSLTGSQTFNFVITATFTDNTKITEEKKSVPVDCGGATVVTTQTFTLSSGTGTSDYSYYDLDAQQAYKAVDANTRTDEIDLIAFASGVLGDSVWSAEAVSPFDEDAFVTIWEVPAASQAAAYAALTAANPDFAAFEAMAPAIKIDANKTRNVYVANQKVFIVESTEFDTFAVIITASSLTTTPKTVTLKAFSL